MRDRGEKGSITLFVTISCFFVVMILITFVMNAENKKQAQNKEMNLITKSYETNEQDMEKVYSRIVNESQ